MNRYGNSLSDQRGAATLIVTLLLMLVVAISSMTTARLGIVEGKKVAADVRIREAKQAAEAGLEYGVAWLKVNKCNGGCATVTAPRVSTTTGYTYDPAVSFSWTSGYLLVTSTAVANEETDINAIAQRFLRQRDLLSPEGRNLPPLVVDGCATAPGGHPTIYPRPNGASVLTLATADPGDGTSSGCIDLKGGGSWNFDIDLCTSAEDYSDVACTPQDTSSASTVADRSAYLAGIDLSADPEPTAWNYAFDVPLADAKAQAAAAGQVYASDNAVPDGPGPDVPFVVYTGSNPFNGSGSRTYGSAASPVVLIVTDAGCPSFNGGVTVYGFVYYEADPTVGTCSGWGGANVVGSVILEGNVSNFNANIQFFDMINLDGGGDGGVVFLDGAAQVSGTWKDW